MKGLVYNTEGITYAHLLGNTMYSPKAWDDAIAIYSYHIITWHRFFPNSLCCCIELGFIKWNDDGFIDKNSIGVGAVITCCIWVLAAFRWHRDTHDFVWRTE